MVADYANLSRDFTLSPLEHHRSVYSQSPARSLLIIQRVFDSFCYMIDRLSNHYFSFALVLALFLLAPSTALSQLAFGVSGGLNYGGFSDIELGDSGATYDSRSGYHVGGFVDISAGPLALRPGVYYLNVGAVFTGIREDTGVQITTNGQVTTDYLLDTDRFDIEFISVPIDIRLRMGLPFFTPYFFGGPELRFRSETEVDDYIDNVKPFNLSGNAGIGFEMNLGYLRLMPELRYAFDISGLTGDELEIGERTFVTGEHILNSLFFRVGLVF